MSASSPPPSPNLFFETANAYQRTAAIRAAVELDLFTHIGTGGKSAGQIAADCQSSERGVRILCDYLSLLGFLTKQAGKYALTADSAMFLDRNSPAYAGSAIDFLISPLQIESFNHLAETVRKGAPQMSQGDMMGPEHPVWVRFARGMGPLMAMPAQRLADLVVDEKLKQKRQPAILDIAAGHGRFGIAMAQRLPQARITAQDWNNVLEVARENAAAAGVADRYRALAGDAFEVDFGTGYDAVLLTNFLHHFDKPTCVRLLKKVRAALVPGGRTAILEFIPDADRLGPPAAAAFSMIMLANTAGGDAYPFEEFQKMLNEAGFRQIQLHPLPPTFQRVVTAEV